MKEGRPIAQLASQILEEAKSKKDYIADTRRLKMFDDGTLNIDGGAGHYLARQFKPTKLCLDQIAGRVGIPAKYAERCRTEYPEGLAAHVNHWFTANPERRMVRTLDNGNKVARAFLSDRFRPLDNYDLANVILPKLQAAGCEVKSAELTERRLYIQAVTPRVEGEVKKGDIVQAGIVISNSEVGCGAIKVEPMLYRLVCLNGMITGSGMRRHHIGRAGEGNIEGGGDSFEMFSDKTRQLDDRAFWAKVCDVVDGSLDRIRFNKTITDFRDKADGKIGSPVDAVEVVTRKLELADGESKSVLEHLASGGDLTLWGLANAVTRTAADVASYDRSIELQRAGAYVMELKPSDFSVN